VRILVTGATGFIGSHLVPCLARNADVVALTRRSDDATAREKISQIEMDLSKPLQLSRLPERIDVVIYLAQSNKSFPEYASDLFAVNVISVQELLDYAKRAGAQQFLLASSGDVYGHRSGPCVESDPPAPSSYYAVTKHAAENLVRAYSDYLPGCIVRLFQPYGPGQSGRLIPKLARRILQRERLRLNRDARPFLTPIFVDDVVIAIERAVERRFSGTLNVAGNRTVSIRELAEEVGGALEMTPIFESSGEDAGDMIGDNQLMKRMLGKWDMVSLSDGLERTFSDEEDARWQARV
jgi:nucleoside-diphosphate-sugar epimerase